jgi:protein SCO1/2
MNAALASRVLIILASFALGVALFLGAVLFVSGRNAAVPTTVASAVGGPFQLVDQNGQPFGDQDLKGRPFLVFFGFTHCPDVCPTTLFEVSEILRRLGPDADRTGALFVTVDPERDTPETMKEYLSSFDPHLRGLSGDAGAVAAMLKAYRVYAKKVPLEGGDYTMDHAALVYLMDKNGRFVAPFNVKRKPEDAAAELRRYL